MTTATSPAQIPGAGFALGGDLRVTRVGYGTMRLTDATAMGRPPAEAEIWRAPAELDQAVALLRRAVELGVNLIDTADAYALGESEELVARALHPYPDGLVIATKVGVARPGPTEWVPLGHPAYLRQQVELSLRRLRVERLDLVHLHRIDPDVSLAEQVGTLGQLRQEGKIRHIGLSEATAAQVAEAAGTAPIASVQNLYNVAARHHDPVVDLTAARGIAFMAFFPLAMGDHARPDGPLASVAAELGATPSQVALAWLLHRSPNVIPIPGTSSPQHVEDNVAALRLDLTPEQAERIAAATAAT